MRNFVYSLIVILAALHQDFWFWNDSTLVFDFLPIGLAYHVLFSILCGIVWALATKFAWPREAEQIVEVGVQTSTVRDTRMKA